MPKIKSAKKELRKSAKRHERNLAQKTALKKIIKRYKQLIGEKKLNEAKKELSLVYRALDRAAKVNLLKKNAASRIKSRLNRELRPR